MGKKLPPQKKNQRNQRNKQRTTIIHDPRFDWKGFQKLDHQGKWDAYVSHYAKHDAKLNPDQKTFERDIEMMRSVMHSEHPYVIKTQFECLLLATLKTEFEVWNGDTVFISNSIDPELQQELKKLEREFYGTLFEIRFQEDEDDKVEVEGDEGEGDDEDILDVPAVPQSRDLKAGPNPLKHKFVFWYTRSEPGAGTQASYEESIKQLVDFSTVEGFWKCYCHMVRPSSLPSPTDILLFKAGIRPSKEDSANCNGGKWIILLNKAVSGRFWEELVLALVGDQLEYGENVCGAALSIRFSEDILSVWNRNASDHQAVMALRDSIKRHLRLPQSYVMEYKRHDASLRDNSLYRNT